TQLSAPDQEMLSAAAVAGGSFAIASIAGALGWDTPTVESRCETLVRQHVILKRGGTGRFPDGMESSGYSFVHALCREALDRIIPPGRRARLHGLLAAAEEKLYAADPERIAGEIAGHFEIAGELTRAIHYLRMAAASAADRYSNQEAAQYMERAFQMLTRLN